MAISQSVEDPQQKGGDGGRGCEQYFRELGEGLMSDLPGGRGGA